MASRVISYMRLTEREGPPYKEGPPSPLAALPTQQVCQSISQVHVECNQDARQAYSMGVRLTLALTLMPMPTPAESSTVCLRLTSSLTEA